jgi:hypothetical protein
MHALAKFHVLNANIAAHSVIVVTSLTASNTHHELGTATGGPNTSRQNEDRLTETMSMIVCLGKYFEAHLIAYSHLGKA